MKRITACTYDCPDACSLVLEQTGDGNLRLRGNPDSPFTRGFMCAKTRRHIRRLESPSRILEPLLKTKGGWRGIGWDAALDLCAEKIQRFRNEPASILHIHSDGAKGALDPLGQSLARGVEARGTVRVPFDLHRTTALVVYDTIAKTTTPVSLSAIRKPPPPPPSTLDGGKLRTGTFRPPLPPPPAKK